MGEHIQFIQPFVRQRNQDYRISSGIYQTPNCRMAFIRCAGNGKQVYPLIRHFGFDTLFSTAFSQFLGFWQNAGRRKLRVDFTGSNSRDDQRPYLLAGDSCL